MSRGRRQAGQRALAGRRPGSSNTPTSLPGLRPCCFSTRNAPSVPHVAPHRLTLPISFLLFGSLLQHPSSRKPSGMYPGWVRCLLSATYGSVPSRRLNHTKSPSAAHQSVSTSRHKGPPLFSSVSRARWVLNTFLKCVLKATDPSAFEQALSCAPVLPCADYHPAG